NNNESAVGNDTSIILREVGHFPVHECGDAQEQAETPHKQTAQFGKFCPTYSFMGQWVHQCNIAIYANQNEEVDAAVEKVSSSQVTQVDLSHGAGLLMKAENHQDKPIHPDSQHTDQQHIRRDHS
uniref:Uncharacterized protein n=1 Tax=Sander lucioperca TaxID=283035 RepID=A0A8C9Z6B6_SANLU